MQKFSKTLRQISVAAGTVVSAALLIPSAHASAIMYDISSAPVDSSISPLKNDASTNLRMFKNLPDSAGLPGSVRFDFTQGAKFVVNYDGSATLTGKIVSRENAYFGFDVQLNFAANTTATDAHRGLRSDAYLENGGDIDASLFQFFDLTNGTVSGTNLADGFSFDVAANKSVPAQIGFGANNRNSDFGLGFWWILTANNDCVADLCSVIGDTGFKSDIHVDLVETPLPGAVALFLTGLAGVGASTRRKKQSI